MANLSIKSKLLVMLLAVSLFSIAVVALLNYYTYYKSLQDAVFSHLTSVRTSRADQIEQYFERLRLETVAVAASGLTIDAAREFTAAYRKLGDVRIEPQMDEAVRQYYHETFAPAFEKATGRTVEVDTLLPEDPGHTVSAVLLRGEESFPDRRERPHVACRRWVGLQPRARDIPSPVAASDADLGFPRALYHRHRDRRDRLYRRQAPGLRDAPVGWSLRTLASGRSVQAGATSAEPRRGGDRGFRALSAESRRTPRVYRRADIRWKSRDRRTRTAVVF